MVGENVVYMSTSLLLLAPFPEEGGVVGVRGMWAFKGEEGTPHKYPVAPGCSLLTKNCNQGDSPSMVNFPPP